MTDSAPRRPKRRAVNTFVETGEGVFEVAFQGRARRAYLWVILIFSPLPLMAVAALLFGVLEAMRWHFLLLVLLQGALAAFAVVTMRSRIAYSFDTASGLIRYRRTSYKRDRMRPFANIRNLRHIFVSSQIVGKRRRYLVFQLRGLQVDGEVLNLSGFETGIPDDLNRIGEEAARRLELPFLPAEPTRITRLVRRIGKKTEYFVENIRPAA